MSNNNNRDTWTPSPGMLSVGDPYVSISRFGKEKVDNIGWEGQFMDVPVADQVEDGAATQVLKVEATDRQLVRHHFPAVSTVPHNSNGGLTGAEMGEHLEVDHFRYRPVAALNIHLQ